MKSADPEGWDRVNRALEKVNSGTEICPVSGRNFAAALAPEDLEVDLEAGDLLWVEIFEDIAATLGESGLPVPTEEAFVLSHIWGIRNVENQRFAREMIRQMCYGRNEGLNTKFEKQGGGGRQAPKPRRR